MTSQLSIIMIGATGAVGTQVVKALVAMNDVSRITLLGRRRFDAVQSDKITQHIVDVLDPQTYRDYLKGYDAAICTLGVGEPSKASHSDFIKIDKDAVLAFGTACQAAGVQHFELLSSVGANDKSRSFFLRTKGELNTALGALGFARLSLFQPSMILTPSNRYGVSQALTLAIWPKLDVVLAGPARKYRGIKVANLGQAIAANVVAEGAGIEVLHWDEMQGVKDAF